jgi:hypothetical protein
MQNSIQQSLSTSPRHRSAKRLGGILIKHNMNRQSLPSSDRSNGSRIPRFLSGKFIKSQFGTHNFRRVPKVSALSLITTFFKRRKLSMMSLSLQCFQNYRKKISDDKEKISYHKRMRGELFACFLSALCPSHSLMI